MVLKFFTTRICFALKVKDPLPKKFFARHDECAKDAEFSATYNKKESVEKFVKDFT
jgi:hypothetical protein